MPESIAMTPDSERRVLVIAEFEPGSPGGSWVIIKQLLRGSNWEHIYWWSLFGEKVPRRTFGGRHHSFNLPQKLAPNRRFKGLKGAFLEHVVTPLAARDLLAFVGEVKPDFILFLDHLWGIPIVCRVMPRVKTHWHVALHDMPDTAGWVATLGPARAARFMRDTEIIYREASSRAVISPAMAEDMRMRTGIACENIFRCAVEPETLARLREPAAQPKDDVIRIGYAGTIIAEETFARFVDALRTSRDRLNRTVELHLFGWHSYRDRPWFDPELIIEHGPLSEAEIHTCFQEFNWGLAIMKLDDADPRYNRFSFPCKFTAALAAGLPLICMGHRRSALIQLVQNYRLGMTLTEEDVSSLSDKLGAGLADYSRFADYRSEIARCAETEFNAERNRAKLRELITASDSSK